MGYSCNAAASFAAEYLIQMLQITYGDAGGLGNGWGSREPNGTYYFYERGREQSDGAVTASVYRCVEGQTTCKRAGNIRIEPNGVVTRWPNSMASQRTQSYEAARTKMLATFGKEV